MALKSFLLIFAVTFSGVAPWTVDLPEVRKYFFEKHESNKAKEKLSYALNKGESYFDNIKADSPHNKPSAENSLYEYLESDSNDDNDVYNSGKYAGDFGYQPYREKEVHSIVRDGSVYLEGLRRAIEQYAERLKECQQKTPSSTTQPSTTKPRWLPENERPLLTLSETTDCERVSRASEHVRRLAELALWATTELQDRAYNDKYDGPSAEAEEKELLLRLAWFLDRLAALTGYRPQPQPAAATTTTTTTTPQPVTLVPSSQEIVNYLLQCIKRNGDPQPVTDRCRYPLTLPASVSKMFNVTATTVAATNAPPSSTQINNHYPNDIVYLMQKTNSEILESQETKHALQKRSTGTSNPAIHIIKYYVKHKVWENDNPVTEMKTGNQVFEIQNHLTDSDVKTKEKRSIDDKKSIHFRWPQSPKRGINYYEKHYKGMRIVKDETQALKIKQYLDKIRNNNTSVAKKNALKLEKTLPKLKRFTKRFEKKLRPKRSVTRKYQPRIPDNPMQDISYYIKHKRGTNIKPNAEQATLYRRGLDQIFQTGNIEVVRRYGSNYNAAVPNAFAAGVLRTYADA